MVLKINQNYELSTYHLSQLIFHSEKTRSIYCPDLQCFDRSKSRGDETLQFLVEAVSREYMNTGWRIRSRKKRHPGLVQGPHDLEFFLDEFLARHEIIRAVALRNFLGESLPRPAFPRCWHIFHARIFAVVAHVDQIAAAFPHQRGTLPRLILRQNFCQ